MAKNSLIRTIYLYLFAMLGLVLLTIGGVRFLDMGLKAFIFTQAEERQRLDFLQPPLPYSLERVKEIQETGQLSEEEKTQIKQFLADYQRWQESYEKIDPVTASRHREASLNLALILIGLPLYLYHWGVIRKETKK